MVDFDVDNWSALLPSFSQDEIMNMNTLQEHNDMDFFTS